MSTAAQIAHDATVGAVKAAPAVAVVGTGATGAINWNDVAYALTALYMLAQIVLLLPRFKTWLREMRGKKVVNDADR